VLSAASWLNPIKKNRQLEPFFLQFATAARQLLESPPEEQNRLEKCHAQGRAPSGQEDWEDWGHTRLF